MIAPATSPCSTCTEGCCHEYLVTVTGLDVYRITRGLSLAPAQFTVAVPIVKPGIEGFRLGAADDRFQFALDKQRGASRAGWCVFWLPFGETAGRCGIYKHRPQVCQTYPATMVDGEVARRDDVLCPAGSWGPGSSLMGEAWRRRVERQFAEYELDAIVNRRWNASAVPGDAGDAFDAYATWVLAVYAELDCDPAAPLDWTSPDRSVLGALETALDAHPPGGAPVGS